jgi:aryl-phospho-beta-D-glucosidase BglC (GH1 family)
VNLGSLFIIEPWLSGTTWSNMGCSSLASEFDCMRHLTQGPGDEAFAKHWDTWITQSDIQEMASLGLNTVRIPVGYWMHEEIVYRDSEWFPKGGFKYLERVCGWARDAGIWVIVDLHGSPGAQVPKNSFTGQV